MKREISYSKRMGFRYTCRWKSIRL